MNFFSGIIKFFPLFSALIGRQLNARYRGSFFGFFWSLLNPLLLTLLYWVVFRFYLRFGDVENYTVFLLTGLLPWIWVTSALSEGVSSITGSGHLVTKSFFPAQILPAVSVVTTGVHFFLSLPILLALIYATNGPITFNLLFLFPLVLLQGVFLFGIVTAISTWNVRLRDMQHLVANLLSFIFFLCPIVYPVSTVPERFRWTLDLNPFARFIQSYHTILHEGAMPGAESWVYLSLATLVSLLVGVAVFERNREKLPEYL